MMKSRLPVAPFGWALERGNECWGYDGLATPFPVPGGSERSRPAAAAWVTSGSAHFAASRASATNP